MVQVTSFVAVVSPLLLSGLTDAFLLPKNVQEVFAVERQQQQQQQQQLAGLGIPASLFPSSYQTSEATTNIQEGTDEKDENDSNNSLSYSWWRPHVPYFMKPKVRSDNLQNLIMVKDLNNTAWDIYHLAEKSIDEYGHPTRVIGSPGHWATIEYILKQFDKMSNYYTYSLQEFEVVTGKVHSYNLSDAKTGLSFPKTCPFEMSPSVEPFVGELVQIPNMGCDEADYATVMQEEEEEGNGHRERTKKRVALIERGICSFSKKSSLAGKYGFAGAVIYDKRQHRHDEDYNGYLKGTLEKITNTTVPTFGVSYEVGMGMVAAIELDRHYSVNFGMNSSWNKVLTKNIIVDTKKGDPNNIVALGAHTDSVAEGPGINDDGSGIISLLTVAKQLAHFKIKNKVRFAFWSAEEQGLIGSTFYADHLSPKENHKIRVFMDYDMMASPNFEYQIYNATNDKYPRGCQELRDLYIDYYESKNLSYTLVPFDGRSDYVGFIKNGIPAGGIAAGAEEYNIFNGEVADICYHQLCDGVPNLSWDAFLVNSKLIAHSVATFADSFDWFPKREVHGKQVAEINSDDANIVSLTSVDTDDYNESEQLPLFQYRGKRLLY